MSNNPSPHFAKERSTPAGQTVSAVRCSGSSSRDVDVVFCNPIGTIGGAERVLLMVMKAAAAEFGSDRLVLLIGAEGPLRVAAEEMGIRTELVKFSAAISRAGESSTTAGQQGFLRWLAATPSAVSSLWRWRAAIRRWRPRIVYSNGIKTHVATAYGTPRGTQVVWHIHDFISQRRISRKLLKAIAGKSTKLVAISCAVADDLSECLPRCQTTTITNAVDTSHFIPTVSQRAESSDQAAQETNSVRVGMVATYALWKGQDVFIEAVGHLLGDQEQTFTNVSFLIIGGPIYETVNQWSREQLVALAKTKGVEGAIEFVDFQADPAPIYRDLDIMVHASIRPEPFGLTIVEAMASGCAVIAANAGAVPNIITDGEQGQLFTPCDSAKLAGKMQALIADEALRQRLGSNARLRAEAEFSENRFSRECRKLFAML